MHHCGQSNKKNIAVAVQPVFLYPLVNQLMVFGHIISLQILQHLVTSYSAIDKIDLNENAVKMMEPYDPTEPLARLIEQL